MARRLLLWPLLLLLHISFAEETIKLADIVGDDAIIIEAADQDRQSRSASPDGGRAILPILYARPALPNPPCYTTAGQLGRCMSFRMCYPYYKVTNHPSWAPLLAGSTDTCSYFGDQYGQPDVFQTFGVCCTSPVTSEVKPLGSWPPPLPTHSPDNTPATHPPDHTPATHPPVFGIPADVPTHPTKRPTTSKKPFSSTKTPTTWATKPSTISQQWSTTHATTLATPVLGGDVSCGSKNGYQVLEYKSVRNVSKPFQDQERIVGGQNAEINEWPWIVALFNGGRQFCGGSLIDSTHILSAAHCIAQMTAYDVARLKAHLGDYNIKTNTEVRHIERRIKRIVRHRGFDIRTLYNDVAVLMMDSPVPFTTKVHPICLPSSAKSYTGKTGTVVGWGSLRENGPQPAVLQKVSLTIWDNNECRMKYGAAAPGGIVEHMVCAGQATKDSCSGDSGGPLMVLDNGRWTQVGIVSWGIGCGKGQYPGVYSRVSNFLPWIKKNCK